MTNCFRDRTIQYLMVPIEWLVQFSKWSLENVHFWCGNIKWNNFLCFQLLDSVAQTFIGTNAYMAVSITVITPYIFTAGPLLWKLCWSGTKHGLKTGVMKSTALLWEDSCSVFISLDLHQFLKSAVGKFVPLLICPSRTSGATCLSTDYNSMAVYAHIP